VSQVAALAAAFGVPPSYLLDRDMDTSVLDEEVLEAPTDEAVGAILRESARRTVAPAPAPHYYYVRYSSRGGAVQTAVRY
jgi:hypothetical protein